MLCYIEGMVDEAGIDTQVIRPLMRAGEVATGAGANVAHIVAESLASRINLKELRPYCTGVEGLLDGDTLLFIEGCPDYLLIDSSGFPSRSVSKPETEHAVRGSREGFTEVLSVNLALIRRCGASRPWIPMRCRGRRSSRSS